jgi:5-methylcytosine-specific restriction protein A
MAVTGGQGNPDWTREEVALALELYFSVGQKMPSASDKKVIALSKLLREKWGQSQLSKSGYS